MSDAVLVIVCLFVLVLILALVLAAGFVRARGQPRVTVSGGDGAMLDSRAALFSKGERRSFVLLQRASSGATEVYARNDLDARVLGPETLFRIGSITKPLVAVLVLRLCGDALDEPVERRTGLRFADGRGSQVTLRHL